MRSYQYLAPPKFTNAEYEEKRKEKEERRRKRIFELVPRRRRSQIRPTQPSPDLTNTTRKKRTVYTYITTPKWLIRFMKGMNSTKEEDPILVTQMPLSLNDVDPLQNQLTIPFSSLVYNKFLTFQEWQITENTDNDSTFGVGAFLVDPKTKQWQVVLKKRVMEGGGSWASSRSYLLGGEWSDIVKANALRDEDNISLWCFRRGGILVFALDLFGDVVDSIE